MPRKLARQSVNAQDQEGVYTASQGALYGDGVLVNGVDGQEARRTHMRAQTMARQAAERRSGRSLGLPSTADQATRRAAAQARDAQRNAELAGIDAAHQVWLDAQTDQATITTP